MAIRDKIVNTITGRNVETVPMELEQIVELLKKHYISQANTDEEYSEIMKTVKGGIFLDKKLASKDGKYSITCMTGQRVSIFNLKRHNVIWIHDLETDKFYEYCAWSFKKLRNAVKQAIASAKAGI